MATSSNSSRIKQGSHLQSDDLLWYKDAIFYEIYVRAFKDSNGDGCGDLRGVIEKLDYLQDLGVTCLWLLPIYSSPLKDDGYDISNYYDIHPDYGSLGDFQLLLDEAHHRGIRVIIDLVLNHTSDQHPWFQAARADPDSGYRDYYVWSDTNSKYADARIIFLDTETSNWTWDEQAGQYYWHRFFASQPDLNYDNPLVQQEMLNILRFWLDLGVDGFRADAVPYLFERDGTNCENLPETHTFLKKVRYYMDQHYPGRILLAEANQRPEDVRPYFGNHAREFHMGFHFPIMPRIFMSLRKGDRLPLESILQRTPEIPSDCQWCIFLRNHDELSLEMVTDEERQWMWQAYAPDGRMRLNLGIRRRLAPLLENNFCKLELAYSLLFTLPGSPVIYYGDEIGMGDNIWLNDRNGVRTPMQWNAETNAGFSKPAAQKLYAPIINDDMYSQAIVNVEDQEEDPDSLLNQIRQMTYIRKQHRAFGWGGLRWIDVGTDTVAAYLRHEKDETLFILNNLSDQVQDIFISRSLQGQYENLLTGDQLILGEHLQIKPYRFFWLQKQGKGGIVTQLEAIVDHSAQNAWQDAVSKAEESDNLLMGVG
jgi:maltose alpha-D-glucosyltransferase/alpha-amylase